MNNCRYSNYKWLGFCFTFLLSINISHAQNLQIADIECDYRNNPLGVTAAMPNFNWKIVSKQRNILQTAYRIIVADNLEALDNGMCVWDSKKLISSKSIQVLYAGPKLLSAKTYYWRVMIWDNKGNSSAWSKPAKWQMGLLSAADWKNAQWIALENMPDSLRRQPFNSEFVRTPINDKLPLFRKTFTINKTIEKATVFIAGLGHFELSANGKKVGDHFLDAGWTDYNKEGLYVTFDITNQLKKGNNTIGVMLGNGFYFMPGQRYLKLQLAYGFPKMKCRVILNYTDGSSEDITSDTSWKTISGPITFSSIYGGEDYNANLEQTGWNKPGFNDQLWQNSIIVDGPVVLNAQTAEPLKIFETFKPKTITQPKPGIWVYDLGQNASGIPSMTVQGKKGAVIRLYPSELLDSNGTITTLPIGTPVYFDYTLKGNGKESWQPKFMYYGFRYVQVVGAVPAGETNKEQLPIVLSLTGLHTRNAAPEVGTFSCSNETFNKIFHLIDWAIRSNMSSVLTDCPHREKLGWLEEAHLVGPSIRYTYDIAGLCGKIVKDMMNTQTPDGLVPSIAPEYGMFGGPFRDSPEWGSNCIIMPWYMHEWYGDTQLLNEAYPMMQRYIAYLKSKSKNHILSFGLGDWYDIGPKEPGPSQLTPNGITATAFYYYDLTIMSKIARLSGKLDDAINYDTLAANVKSAYNNKFFNKNTKQYARGSQTANAISVYMNLVESEYKDAVLQNIVKELRSHNKRLTAGDIGYRYLLRVLDENNLSNVIYDMNSDASVPGYAFQLAKGATALTESWQAYANASNNHMMLGHLMEWLYSGLAGIKSAKNAIAFKEIVIQPQPVGDIIFAKASYDSPYGNIMSEWEKTTDFFKLDIEIPANTTAVIYLPAKQNSVITENGKSISTSKDMKSLGFEKDFVKINVGSGVYHFKVE